jgi:hypothetical protein
MRELGACHSVRNPNFQWLEPTLAPSDLAAAGRSGRPRLDYDFTVAVFALSGRSIRTWWESLALWCFTNATFSALTGRVMAVVWVVFVAAGARDCQRWRHGDSANPKVTRVEVT